MERICRLPAAPRALFDCGADKVVLVFAQGLASVCAGQFDWLQRGEVGGAARDAHGALYCTIGKQIVFLEEGRATEPQDLSAAFGGPPGGARRVSCTPDGDLWVEGCAKRRRLDGSFADVPPGLVPVPLAVDLHGNLWGLTGEGQMAVLSANQPTAWQVLPGGEGPWQWLVADSVGFVWVSGPAGLRRFDPRHPEQGGQLVGPGLPAGGPTALGLSPDDLVLAGFATGEVLELNLNGQGELIARPLASAPGAVRAVHTDGRGAVWAATDEGLYRCGPAADAWQHAWEELGRLPGGNHDIFAAPLQGKLYVAGGLTSEWGFPADWHVFDELWAFDPRLARWEEVSRMSFPRRYNGIAALDGRIWIVGGEGKLKDLDVPKGERTTVDVVEIYDPTSNTWAVGPRLNNVRTDPFVMAEAGRIWAVGGACNPTTPIATVESIAPGESAWRNEPPLPLPTRQGGCAALEGVLYCVSTEGVFAFDTAARQWLTGIPQLEKLPQAALVTAFAGEVWVMGGYLSKDTFRYSPTERKWRPGPPLPTQQSWGAAAVLEDRLYIIGGAHRSEPQGYVVYDDRTYVLRPGWA